MPAEKYRRAAGMPPRNFQEFGKFHQFPCGCSGVLPDTWASNLLVFVAGKYRGRSFFGCRVRQILYGSNRDAKKGGYTPIAPDTPHYLIRQLMEEPNCERCGEPLVWGFQRGKTPHLHHNHETGEMYGFVHARCNIWELYT